MGCAESRPGKDPRKTALRPIDLITAEKLKDMLNKVCILDCSTEEKDGKTAKQQFDECHISGALFFDTANCRDADSGLPNTLPVQEKFIEHMKALGVGLDKPVVCYDNSKNQWASRAAFLLRAYGHRNVFVFAGGVSFWNMKKESAAGQYPTVQTDENAVLKGDGEFFNYELDESQLIRYEELLATCEKGDYQIIDARPQGFDAGHVTNAINVPMGNFIYGSPSLFKKPDEVKAALVAAGVNPSKPIVVSCGSGIGASVVLVACH